MFYDIIKFFFYSTGCDHKKSHDSLPDCKLAHAEDNLRQLLKKEITIREISPHVTTDSTRLGAEAVDTSANPVDSYIPPDPKKVDTLPSSAETDGIPLGAKIVGTPNSKMNFDGLQSSGQVTGTPTAADALPSGAAVYISEAVQKADGSSLMSEKCGILTTFYRQMPLANIITISGISCIATSLYDYSQQNGNILCNSENADSSRPTPEGTQGSYMQLSRNGSQNSRKLGTVRIKHGNSSAVFQSAFIANVELLQSGFTTGSNVSVPTCVLWIAKEENVNFPHPYDAIFSSLYKRSIYFLVNKHNNIMDWVTKFLLEQNYEEVDALEKSFVANNNASDSGLVLLKKNKDITSKSVHHQLLDLARNIRNKVDSVEENLSNREDLLNSPVQQMLSEGDFCTEEIKKFLTGPAFTRRRAINDNQFSRQVMNYP